MADSAEDGGRRTAGSERVRPSFRPRRVTPRHLRVALGIAPRLALLLMIVWAFTGRVDRMPAVAGAASLVPAVPAADSAVNAAPVFQETGYAVAEGAIGAYFRARGGVRTFGPPISNEFTLLGSQVQLFRNHLLKIEANGSVSTVNLFAMGAIPFRNVGGRIIPEVDQGLVASAPVPGAPDYAVRVLEFIRANAPDQWEGLPVGFHQKFLETVRAEDALTNGGEPGLLPGFSHEVWGVPVSRPVRDAQDPDVILLRWERGVMAFSRQSASVSTIPLGEAFKAVLTGEGLGPERTAAAQGSQFLLQYQPGAPDAVARANDLPATVLVNAFTQGAPAVNAAQLANQPTATPVVPLHPHPATAIAAASGAGAPVPTGADPCYQDEQITFSPDQPRVNNELLIAVTSSRPHPYGRLAGTEKTTFVRERPGQLGYVWEWTVLLSYPGTHKYTFFVDSTIPCREIEIQVLPGLATRTPKPTRTPTPYNWNENNDNGSGSGNDNDFTTIVYAPGVNPADWILPGVDWVDCGHLASQSNAQRVLRYDPSDPNRLDAEDGVEDGIACSTYFYASYPNDRDFNSVARIRGTATPPPTATPSSTSFDPNDYIGQGDRYNCVDFQSQAQAQAVLRADPNDPNRLDTSSPQSASVPDGIACSSSFEAPEWAQGFYYPEPHDRVPVPTPSPGRHP